MLRHGGDLGVVPEQVVDLLDHPREAVFDWQDSGIHVAIADGREDVREGWITSGLGLRKQPLSGFVRVSSRLPLVADLGEVHVSRWGLRLPVGSRPGPGSAPESHGLDAVVAETVLA
jgi:hypothetical protein